MPYSSTIRGERFVFADLRELLARAGEQKSGDELAGLGAKSAKERIAAQLALAEVTLQEILLNPVIDPERDDVSRLILQQHDASAFNTISSFTVGHFREFLLSHDTPGDVLQLLHRAITPEMAAAVCKLMGNLELAYVARKIRVVTRCRNTLGGPGILGIRLQPNHPTDDLPSILLAALDGLAYGCGDAVIGVNPAVDSTDSVGRLLHGLDRLIETLKIPTQHCVLAHITTQLVAMQQGAPIDLLFQSLAGSEAANASFGVSLALLREGREHVLDARRNRNVNWVGEQVMYFETGQGSALSAEAHHGVDQLTLEARAYAVAREYDPFLVNSVVGFIGPEYLANERQIIRAGLEDHFMGKLLGLPMGSDICYTNHADADQNSADSLLMQLACAGVNYIMGVPAADDVMLNYQSTSYHDGATIRELLGLRAAPEFEAWLEACGIIKQGRLTGDGGLTLLPECKKLLALPTTIS